MGFAQNRQSRRFPVRASRPFEMLEQRCLLSATVAPAPISPVTALTIHAVSHEPFSGVVGVWSTKTGIPTASSGLKALADVEWGDGSSSRATLIADGNGIVQIDASHTYAKPGVFTTLVNVEELPVVKPGQPTPPYIIEVGQDQGKAVVARHPLLLSGKIAGSYLPAPGIPDIGARYVFNGVGTAGAIGPVALSGTLTLPGFIATGHLTGTLTLKSVGTTPAKSGSVTISVTGPTEKGFGPFPTELKYTITGGAGAFAGTTGSGTITVSLDAGKQTFIFTIHSLLPAT